MATTTYEPIATQTLGSTASAVTFNSIPQTYTDLIVVVNAAYSGTVDDIRFRVGNGGTLDSGNNYSYTIMYGTGASAGSVRASNQSSGIGDYYASPNTTLGATNQIFHFQNYSNTTTYKTILFRSSRADNGVDTGVNLWRSTNAITDISFARSSSFSGTWATGSTFTLYGIANANTGAKATGGVITYDSTYYYHTFGTSGTFTPTQSLTADILVVAGGGGGGYSGGGFMGGGGAGGLLNFTAQALTSATNYTCTVGSGGAINTNGVDSQFGSLTLVKGGGKGATASAAAGTGGSGGGGSEANSSGGSATSGQGNAGGTSTGGATAGGGGGGGAGAVGGNAVTGVGGGAGGAGLNTWSSWALATGTGVNGYYAGGGGGTADAATPGAGGVGGGGTGADYNTTAGVAGIVNTGGGGGAGGGSVTGGAGGSGIIIIRYLKA